MDNGTNRVYVNPNFQRSKNLPPKNVMHVNPNFPQYLRNVQANSTTTSSKIYINPNFIKTNAEISTTNIPKSSNITEPTKILNVQDQQNRMNEAQSVQVKPVPLNLPLSKSRYSIVRHKSIHHIKENQPVDKTTATYKVNKYKSVSLQQIKKNIQTEKLDTRDSALLKSMPQQVPPQQRDKRLNVKSSNRTDYLSSQYRFVSSKLNCSKTEVNSKKTLTTSTKTMFNLNQISKSKVNKKHFKKNNIPCPLFKKYGKCLRNIQGYCEFLHDKKHVSICKKFLKGMCYNEECLLSHDISKEKMPTCSFYLKGMCTKEDCPYLHVKLNEKTKLCFDFLKGYCERGVECLNRHINICPDMATRGICLKKQCPYPHKSIKKTVITTKSIKTKKINRNIKLKSQHGANKAKKVDPKVAECRYYKDVAEDLNSNVTCEVIKPSRCKLGSLPSFIQL